MPRIEVVLRNIESTGFLSMLVDIEETTQFGQFTNQALGSANPASPVDPSRPYITFLAIEAACHSGARYAKHLVDKPALAVNLVSFDIRGDVENVIPFAAAVAVAACRAFDRDPKITDPNWALISAEVVAR
jgi:hypothetical protein